MAELGRLSYKLILFGDKKWAEVLDEYGPYKNEQGVMVKRYLVVPSEDLKAIYPELQHPESYDYKGIAIWREYPDVWVWDDDYSHTGAIVIILCTYDSHETNWTRKFEGKDNQIIMLEHENDALKIANMLLQEEKMDLLSNQLKVQRYLKQLNEANKSEVKEPPPEEQFDSNI